MFTRNASQTANCAARWWQAEQSRRVAIIALGLLAILTVGGCTAMYPQYAAQQCAPLYYEGGYNTLTPQQKFQLENHLANQSNQAWRTTAQVAGGFGHLLGGTGQLVGAIRAFDGPRAGSRPVRIARARIARFQPALFRR